MPSYTQHEAFQGEYLKTDDVRQSQGKVMNTVIEKVISKTVESEHGADVKLCALLRGEERQLVLNKSRCEDLEDITGTDDYDKWRDVPVTIVVDEKVKFAGKKVGGMRLEGRAGDDLPAPDLTGGEEEDIPF